MSRPFVLLAAVALTGCTSQLTRAGAPVTQVRPEATTRCRLLAAVEGSGANGASVSENERSAMNDVRNRVGSLGGNAFEVAHLESTMWRTTVKARAYLCPQWEPVPGLAPTPR